MPVLTACRECGRATSIGIYCSRCAPAADAKRRARDRPGRGTKADRELTKRVVERDHGICWLCGKPGANSKDHVIPYARGGATNMANLRAAHLRCNQIRGARG